MGDQDYQGGMATVDAQWPGRLRHDDTNEALRLRTHLVEIQGLIQAAFKREIEESIALSAIGVELEAALSWRCDGLNSAEARNAVEKAMVNAIMRDAPDIDRALSWAESAISRIRRGIMDRWNVSR